jgi:hypothetical protein
MVGQSDAPQFEQWRARVSFVVPQRLQIGVTGSGSVTVYPSPRNSP